MKSRRVFSTVAIVFCLLLAVVAVAQRTVAIPDGSKPTTDGTLGNPKPFDKVTTGGSATAIDIQTSAGRIYGLQVSAGSGTAVVYANFFNAVTGSVTAGTTTPLFTVEIDGAHNQGAVQVVPLGTAMGVPFSTALSYNCTTTRGGATGATAGCLAFGMSK